ncbi:methyltransferase [Agaribacter marinus]|uniref:Ribosomal RNA small subunit methyltransferase C n=1 Tax=Agaribacter marinus TaxID=1431249 RepID=A0AA37T141_9ALTE|nr:methyltransferase [Agaribacter marinus]GLR71730.1 ribosomal RNA small subunit methyltransferase C [Agaribacter marinus]
MLSPASQLIKRNIDIFSTGPWALVNPEDTSVFSLLPKDTIGLHQFHDVYQACSKQYQTTQCFSAFFSKDVVSGLAGVVIYMPKAKQVLDLLLDNLSSYLDTGTRIFVVGENKGGIKSASKVMEKYLSSVNKLDGAKHCTLLGGTLEKQGKHSEFDINHYLIRREYIINDESIILCSLPGVFGHKQLDPGTTLLLNQFSDKTKLRQMRGKLYDFACGTGVIGTYFKQVNPKLKLTLSDLSALAIYCTQETLKANNIEGEVLASDGMQAVNKSFDHIVSNPPFHSGLKNDYEITQRFIQDAHAHCIRMAKLTLVANRFLPYADCIKDTFNNFDVLAKSNKFTVYQTTKR